MNKIDSIIGGSFSFGDDSKFVCLKRMLNNQRISGDLCVPLGRDENGYHYIDFSDISCLMVCGETGSGKSIFLDSVITSLMLRNSSDMLKFVMMDPKKIELSYYNGCSYMESLVLYDAGDCYRKLIKIKKEYERRSRVFDEKNVKDIYEYNSLSRCKDMYHLFVIIDESCELMDVEGSEELLSMMVDDCASCGIHFVIATNSFWDKYFSSSFVKSIKYKITFDLTCRALADVIGIKDSDILNAPGEAIVSDKMKNIKLKIQTPYISDDDIMRVIEYVK